MFPVTVRRLRDAKVRVGLATIMMPAVVFFAAVAVFYPWFACVSALILLVPGILPSRAGADDGQVAGVATKTKMCYRAALCFIIATTCWGIAAESLILRLGFEKMAAKMAKKMAKKYRTSYSETSQSKEKSEKAESAWGESTSETWRGERSGWGEKSPETRWGERSDWKRDEEEPPKRGYGW